ncbi:MAG: hypothetical protein M9939_17130 [Mesorhizobium sp.]|nr:hypothetical protein [Mesorhizobium sp.]MCO5162860.1 hypothetical protein [Mesorhizobium sp.]
MSKAIVETVYGKFSKFEVEKHATTWSTTFRVLKDGKYLAGFDSLARAVEYAKKEAGE